MNTQFNLFEKLGEYFKPRPEYFNTTHLSGTELKAAKDQTGLQNSRVLAIYHVRGELTPVECWEFYCRQYPACPLTSIRRAINSLTGLNLLQKLETKKMGMYGKKNYVWRIVK